MTVGIKPQASLVPQLSTTSVLTFEEVAAIPRPGAQGPSMVKFSPDDRYVTYLGSVEAASLTRQLYVYDRETGSTSLVIAPREGSGEEKSFSKEEALRRERARIMSTGVTEYSWAKNACRLLVPMDGALFVQDGVAEGSADSFRRLFDPDAFPEVGTGPLLDAKLSDDGARCFFVWGGEVCVCEVGSAADECAPRRLTLGARGEEGRTNGLADYCAQEEMSRYSGYWPSPGGGSLVAFEEVDESHIPPFAIMNAGVDSPHEQNEQHRYPFAGAANPKVRLGVVRAGGAADVGEAAAPSEAPTWFDLSGPFGADSYLARVQWDCGGSSLLVQVESRDQRSLALLRCDAATGRVSTVLTEQSDTWVNLHDMLAPLRGGEELVWASERTGWRHLYVHSADGACLRALTSGEWCVEELLSVDEERGHVYFMGNPRAAPDGGPLAAGEYTERHLYRVRCDGSDPSPERLTAQAGLHSGIALSHDHSAFVDSCSSASEPVAAALAALPQPAASSARPAAAEKVLFSARAADARVASLGAVLRPPRFVSFPSSDGAVTLQAAVYEPDEAVFGHGPHPTVVSCYGGPHVQYVQNGWSLATADLRAQFLREQGFLVLKCDNRGSDRRGLAFEGAIKGDLGRLEVDDQVAAVEWAVSHSLADPARVGIMGWSYGGYLSAMCLARAPSTFRCAVAGAPVTSWDGYDTHYTERYMGGTPQSAPEAYERSSVMTHVDGLEGALLLVHGLMDENVHFRHTARLTQAMVEAQKSYELLCFPKERHSPRSLKDRVYMEQRVFSFLQKWLK